jgi:hypothetical protein
VIEGTKTKICQATVCRTCVLAEPRTEIGNQAKQLKYAEQEVVTFYQAIPDVQTYGHLPRFTANANADAAEIDVCTQKCQEAA